LFNKTLKLTTELVAISLLNTLRTLRATGNIFASRKLRRKLASRRDSTHGAKVVHLVQWINYCWSSLREIEGETKVCTTRKIWNFISG